MIVIKVCVKSVIRHWFVTKWIVGESYASILVLFGVLRSISRFLLFFIHKTQQLFSKRYLYEEII